MIKIRVSGRFDLDYKRSILSEPELKEVVWTKIKIFRKKPSDSRLRNHPLKGKLKGKWAFSITDNIRIVYEWRSKNIVRFLAMTSSPPVRRGFLSGRMTYQRSIHPLAKPVVLLNAVIGKHEGVYRTPLL